MNVTAASRGAVRAQGGKNQPALPGNGDDVLLASDTVKVGGEGVKAQAGLVRSLIEKMFTCVLGPGQDCAVPGEVPALGTSGELWRKYRMLWAEQ